MAGCCSASLLLLLLLLLLVCVVDMEERCGSMGSLGGGRCEKSETVLASFLLLLLVRSDEFS